jgi:chromosome segregation ATPase
MPFRIIVFSALLASMTIAHAEPVAKQGGNSDAAQQALKKAQGVLRQLGEEKAVLETEKAALEKDKAALQEQIKTLDATIKQLQPLQAEVLAQKTAAESLRNTNTALSGQLNNAHENERQLKQSQQEIIAQAKLIQADNAHLVAMVKEREQWIHQCSEKNRAVIKEANSFIAQFQNKSLWDNLKQAEPFTGIANVEPQNSVEQYQFKLDDLKVTAFEGAEK